MVPRGDQFSWILVRFPRIEGYRVEPREERLSAVFNHDAILELTPDRVGSSKTLNQGKIGEGVDSGQIPRRESAHYLNLFSILQRKSPVAGSSALPAT